MRCSPTCWRRLNPVEELRPILPIGPAEECAQKLLAYARAGAQRVFLWPLDDERAQLELFRERVVPLLADTDQKMNGTSILVERL